MKVWARVLLIGCMVTLLSAGSAKQVRADMLTTLFASNNGQAGNMFDINVLAAQGIVVSAFDLNLQAGNWDINLYTLDGLYAGNETNAAAWTLHASITGLASAGVDVPTNWDFADLSLNAGDQAFYVEVTNGFGMAYTNGTAEGAIIAQNSDLQIFEGTGNAVNFGAQFRPRVWNGTIYYNTIPEPNGLIGIAGLALCFCASRRRRSA